MLKTKYQQICHVGLRCRKQHVDARLRTAKIRVQPSVAVKKEGLTGCCTIAHQLPHELHSMQVVCHSSQLRPLSADRTQMLGSWEKHALQPTGHRACRARTAEDTRTGDQDRRS